MEILKKFILALLMGFCLEEVYSWNMKPLIQNRHAGGDKDFNNEFKLQSAVSKDLQRDLMKISGKANKNVNANKKGNNGNLSRYLSDHPVTEEITKQKQDIWQGDDIKEQKRLSDNGVDLDKDNDIMQKLKAATKYPDGSDTNDIKLMQDYEQFKRNDVQNINNDRQSFQLSSDDYPFTKYNSSLRNLQNEVSNFKPFKGLNFQNIYADNKYLNGTSPSLRYFFPLYDENRYLQNQTNYKHFSANNQKSEEVNIDEKQNQNEQNEQLVENSEEDFPLQPVSCPAKGVSYDKNSHGSKIFESTIRKCQSRDYLIILTIRKDFEDLMTNDLPQCLLDDKMVAILMNYFFVCHRLINSFATGEKKILVLNALIDALGGYLNFYLVPVAKFSFYAGRLGLETTNNILRLHQQCKNYLNTTGVEWKAPIRDVLTELGDVSIEPLHIYENGDIYNRIYCMNLNIYKDGTTCDIEKMLVPLPKLEVRGNDTGQLGNIWLPFRRKRVYDLTSPSSSYVVVRYYENVSKCYLYESLKTDCYDRKFQKWILDNLHTHISDDVFYPGLGGVLRVSKRLRWLRNRVSDDSSVRNSGYAPKEMRLTRIYKSNNPFFTNIRSKLKRWNTENLFFKDLSYLIEKSKNHHSPRAHRQYLSQIKLRLTKAALEDQAMPFQTTKSQYKFLNMTLAQWLIIILPFTFLVIISNLWYSI